MTETILARRARLLGPNLPTFYTDPVHLVRGSGVWLWDDTGRKYLDCYNNVPHVGHCHPHVVDAIARQAGTLNTHTRYLHDGILDYLDRLTAKFNHDLSQAIMVCTGSEANDIAIRMAEAATGKIGLIATDNTYHGNTKAVSQLSSRKPPIGGYPPHIRLVPAPETLAPLGGTADGQAQVFADNVARAIKDLNRSGHGFAGMMLCPTFANEGLPDLPSGFLTPTVDVIRAAGGLLICDEVQPGFGRVGSHWWGHEAQGFAPDVVTLGKPMGNGHPVACVVTRPDIMADFRNAFGYFNTFGGNPVSCAAAMAVLDVIETENLVTNAHSIGAYALDRMRALDHPLIADARGAGLFFGIELVHADGTPATAFAAAIADGMRNNGVLLNTIGRDRNILKMRPPMPFGRDHTDLAIDTLAQVMADTPYDP